MNATSPNDTVAVRVMVFPARGKTNALARLLVVLLCLAIPFGFLLVRTGDNSLNDYYARYIDHKISDYEHHIDLAYLSPRSLSSYGEHAVDKINFYRENRDTLIALMDEQELGKNPQEIECFLNKAYTDSIKTVAVNSPR
jgi:hypothetical protein